MSDPITLERHLAAHALQERVWGWRCGCLFHSYGKSIAWSQVAELHAEHVADTWREARTVTTVEQLDALPLGSVIRGGHEVIERDDEFDDLWHYAGSDMSASAPRQHWLPALILWTREDGAA